MIRPKQTPNKMWHFCIKMPHFGNFICIFTKKSVTLRHKTHNLMPKQNTALLLSRYIWLLETNYFVGSISLEEIKDKVKEIVQIFEY